MSRADAGPAIPPLPGLVTLLLAGAALHLVITVATRTVVGGYLELGAGALLSYALTAMPLVLAAALVAGRDRWAGARRWLIAAAVAFATVAVVDAAGWIWMSLTWPPTSPDAYEGAALPRSILLVAGTIAAPLLVAGGLTAGRDPARTAGHWRTARWLSVGVAVIVVVLSVIPMLGYSAVPFFDGNTERSLLAMLGALSHLAPVATAVLGLAATRALPRRFLLPEVLIAVGAMAAALGSAAVASAYAFPEGLIVPLAVASTGLALLGFLILALGFFAARISAPGQP